MMQFCARLRMPIAVIFLLVPLLQTMRVKRLVPNSTIAVVALSGSWHCFQSHKSEKKRLVNRKTKTERNMLKLIPFGMYKLTACTFCVSVLFIGEMVECLKKNPSCFGT